MALLLNSRIKHNTIEKVDYSKTALDRRDWAIVKLTLAKWVYWTPCHTGGRCRMHVRYLRPATQALFPFSRTLFFSGEGLPQSVTAWEKGERDSNHEADL